MGNVTRLTGNGNTLSELLGTYMNRMEPFAPASYTLSSVADEPTTGINRHPMVRLAHAYDRKDQADGGPAIGEFYVNASA
jgi:hypothetical protein